MTTFIEKLATVLLCVGLAATSLTSASVIYTRWIADAPQPMTLIETVRVPYAIVEERPDIDTSLTQVAMLGVMRPDDNWATTFATYDTLAACEAELGDTAYLYREQWPMAVMWCAVNGGPVAIVRPQPRPEELK